MNCLCRDLGEGETVLCRHHALEAEVVALRAKVAAMSAERTALEKMIVETLSTIRAAASSPGSPGNALYLVRQACMLASSAVLGASRG